MMKITFLVFLSKLAHIACAQEVQWASRVLDVSSELFSIEYSADQCLGEPNVYPDAGENPGAWSPKSSGNEEYIKVGFETPMPIRQIIVVETHHPGALARIFVYSPEGVEYLVFELPFPNKPRQEGLLNLYIDQTAFEVAALRLDFDGSRVPGLFNIDAIGISSSLIPIQLDVNVKEEIKPKLLVEKLGVNINSNANEINPILAPDGRLFFTRQYHPGNVGGVKDPGDIWVSEFDEASQSWLPAQNIGSPLNTEGYNLINSFSVHLQGLIAVLGNEYRKSKLKEGVSLSNNFDGGWSRPVALEFVNQVELRGIFDLALSQDRKILLMANHGQATYGDKDLYVSFIQNNGLWSDPLNLGSDVNTVNRETDPFLMPDEKTLYFSSDGLPGFGGSDIYVTQRLDNTWKNWTTPENLGSDINTAADERYFYFPVNSDYAYFSRFDKNNNADIFRVQLPLIVPPVRFIAFKGSFYDSLTREPIEAEILTADSSYWSTGHTFEFQLPEHQKYQFLVIAKGYHPKNVGLEIRTNQSGVPVQRDVYLKKIDEVIRFENITFVFNRATLQEEAFRGLDRIVEILQSQPDISLEVASHTDSRGSSRHNMKLSKARGEAVFNYLVKQGIEPGRLVVRWYGESRPIASNKTEAGRSKNRRVEFRIIRE